MVCGILAVFVSSGCGGCGPARGESELLLASVSGGELLLRSSSLCRSLPTVKINDAKP